MNICSIREFLNKLGSLLALKVFGSLLEGIDYWFMADDTNVLFYHMLKVANSRKYCYVFLLYVLYILSHFLEKLTITSCINRTNKHRQDIYCCQPKRKKSLYLEDIIGKLGQI